MLLSKADNKVSNEVFKILHVYDKTFKPLEYRCGSRAAVHPDNMRNSSFCKSN